VFKYILAFLLSFSVIADENNQGGDLNTNTQNSTVNSNNATNSKTYNGAGASGMPVASTISPSLMSSGNDSCLRSEVGGIQLAIVGMSHGKYHQDEECNRRKNAKTLKELGMSVASVALMCQKLDIWTAMFTAGTPCPIMSGNKLIVGRNAYLLMRQSPAFYIPDYSDKSEFYNTTLRIGDETDEEDTDTRSISERFRTRNRD
jgi:hypothetical protein